MDEDCGMENTVRVEIEVLNSVVPKEAFEEVAGRKRESALRETREHRDLVLSFLHWVRISGGGSPHIHLLLQINPLLRRANKSSVFTFDFFHSRLGSGRGGDIGGAAPVAAAVASSRPLFFPTAFVDLDGEGFILQVHGVFTHIRLGATLEALGGGALGSTTEAARAGSGSVSDLFEMATVVMGEKP
jgi:hypothetical protein